MSVFTVVHPFHYTVTADTFNEAIKYFVKSHRDMNINHLIIKDQERHMEARVKKFWKDGRNFLGLNVYPVENPLTGQIHYMNSNLMRGGAEDEDEDNDSIENFEDLLDDDEDMEGGTMLSSMPYNGFMGSAAIPAVQRQMPFQQVLSPYALSPYALAGGIAPAGVTSLRTTPTGQTQLQVFPQTGTNVATTIAGTTVASPTFNQAATGTQVLPSILNPAMGGLNAMVSPGLGGLGPMITTNNRFTSPAGGKQLTPATSVFPTFDQNNKRHMTIAMSPTKTGIAPAGATTILPGSGGMPFVGGIPGTSVMAPMGGMMPIGGIAPVGLAATSLSNPPATNITGQVNLTPTGTSGATGTAAATGAAGSTPSSPNAAGNYNFTATINLNPFPNAVRQPEHTYQVQINPSNVIQSILIGMQNGLGNVSANYTNDETNAIEQDIKNKIAEYVSNTPTTNNTTTYQDIINQFKDITNRYLGGTPTDNVKGFATQINSILDQFQSQIQGQLPVGQQQYNPGTVSYLGSNITGNVIPAGGFPAYGFPFGQKNSWSPKIVDKKN